ncbi:MAG: hypothetical protein Q8M26_13880, partial [Pseudolabrys sp.]|nr:hypothetical protein [Pseudolabrys sp.]
PSAPCLRIKAFWASENRDAFMALRSSQPGIGAEDSNQKRSSLAGADQPLIVLYKSRTSTQTLYN